MKILRLTRKTGISKSTYYRRLREGMTRYAAATMPINKLIEHGTYEVTQLLAGSKGGK
ncbi:hypothetical protein QRE66_12180 [Bacillus cereus]|uniref:hypothetical protein n=1 Tax=Bacillus pseudomycoides TaxID=64104 RepID=UPI001483A2BA|nr:hypothetical protein [Bacillus pseudomycoides]WJE54896.1 hypothetical protein QRE66_12180 [Bacillus cereus]